MITMTTTNLFIDPPKLFVGLHSHSNMSLGDAIGKPADHIDFALSNGMDSLALTDHGNMNGYSFQQVHSDKLKKKGIKFKPLSGTECYFLPSLEEWRKAYAEAKETGTLKPKKSNNTKASKAEDIGNEMASTEAELEEIKGDDEEDGGTIVENEEESKSNKYNNPLKQRSHLVLLAKNSEGLKSLFRVVSDSAIHGFYNVPRVDFDSLKKNANGNIIATSACVAGYPSKIIFNNQDQSIDWKDWKPNNTNFEKIQRELAESISKFQEVLGPENYYLEIQFNKLGVQALVNMHLIEASKRTGAKLVVTCDAHYSNPKHWKEREIYKALAWHGAKSEPLPERIEDLKCELYPKNAQQVWDTFVQTTQDYDFYDPKVIKEAIERTYDIAHNQIGEVIPDRSVKLPALNKIIPLDDLERIRRQLGEEGRATDDEAVAFRELKELAIQGLKWRKVTTQEYIDRLKEELDVIRHMKFSRYFITYYWIMKIIGEHQILGPGRGSAAGSLLAYVLGITQVDSVKHGCLFERFMTKFKQGYPDVDSDCSNRDEAVKLISEFFGEENVIPVSNFNQLQLASLCKDLAKMFNVPFELVNSYTYKMRSEAMAVAKQQPGFDAQVWDFTLEVAEKDSPSFIEFMREMEKYPDFYNALTILFKQGKSCGKHAGGVILTDNARSAMPLIKAKGGIQTPWPEGLANRHLEDFGLLKFDILGLGTLRMFEDCIRRILKKNGIKAPTFAQVKAWYDKNLHPDNNTMDDQHVYKNVFWEGRFCGIFQFVQKNTQEFMAQMKPTCLYDIAVATSIHRPGPLCISGDSKILVHKHLFKGRTEYRYKTIKQLYEDRSSPVPHGRYKNTIVSLNEGTNTLLENKIVDVMKSGVKEVFELQFQTSHEPPKVYTNKTIRTTKEHRFLTLNGWKELKNLTKGEYLFFINRGNLENPLGKGIAKKLIPGQKNFRNIAFRYFQYKCVFCNWREGSLDANHIDGNRRTNNHPDNLCYMCPNHHRQFSEGTLSKEETKQAAILHKLTVNEDVYMVKYVGCKSVGFQETYDISMASPYNNFIAGGFVVHNSLQVDKAFLNNRLNPESVVYKHPLLKEVYTNTSGLLVFQEQLQMTYHKLAGVPLDQTDGVRKAFTKKDMSNKEKAAKDRDNLRKDFAEKCLSVNGIESSVSNEIFDEMEKLIAYSFNFSHGLSYGMITYMCAHMLTYHPDEWVATYIDYCTTEKGTVAGKEDPKVIAIQEARQLGYDLAKPDINVSEYDFTNDPTNPKILVPSMASLKYVGRSALGEIKQHRPYRTVEELLINPDNTWRHSRFNKRSLETLIKLEALGSMGIVGPGKQFRNYKEMYDIVVKGYDKLKSASMRKKNNDVSVLLQEKIKEYQVKYDVWDWTTKEKIDFSYELSGTVDMNLILPPNVKEQLLNLKIRSIDEWDGKGSYWAVVSEAKMAVTKTGKPYLRMKLFAESNEQYGCFVWNYKKRPDTEMIHQHDVVAGFFDKSNFGLSTFDGKFYKLTEQAR